MGVKSRAGSNPVEPTDKATHGDLPPILRFQMRRFFISNPLWHPSCPSERWRVRWTEPCAFPDRSPLRTLTSTTARSSQLGWRIPVTFARRRRSGCPCTCCWMKCNRVCADGSSESERGEETRVPENLSRSREPREGVVLVFPPLA